MEPSPDHPLKPHLDKATETLANALETACEVDVGTLDTGELIRIEEVLSIAGDAAKRAVSYRRRLHEDAERARATSAADAEAPEVVHRYFDDATGRRWDAFAVHPTEDVAGRARLPEPYRGGWLAFDSGDEKRRLSPIPDGWASRPEGELRELLERAQLVPGRTQAPDARAEP